MTSYKTVVQWRGRQVETLADIADEGPTVLFVGLNPSPVSVAKGHYHQGRLGQQFWKMLVAYGILPRPGVGQFHDDLLLGHNFGITDIVKVPSARADSLASDDLAYGRQLLKAKIAQLRPKIVCSVYKRSLEELCQARFKNRWGLLDDAVEGVRLFVLPFPYRSAETINIQMRHFGRLVRGGS